MEMEFYTYTRALHYSIIETWYVEHGKSKYLAAHLPEYGYVAYHEGEPVAAAFLRQMEGPICYFDGLITNPQASSEIRHYVIPEIARMICELAHLRGYEEIMATIYNESVLKRAADLGFERQPHVFMVKALGGKK